MKNWSTYAMKFGQMILWLLPFMHFVAEPVKTTSVAILIAVRIMSP